MRTLKFRIWDKLRKAFIFYGDIKEFAVELSGRGESLEFPISIYDEEEAVFQQSTGLLDKNGKDVYEGDILRVEYDLPPEYNSKPFIDFVDFYDGNFILDNHREGIGECYHSSVVIGNIFENKELLE